MSKLVITFNDIEWLERNNGYEPGTVQKWVEDGDRAALGEVLNFNKAYDIKLKEEE